MFALGRCMRSLAQNEQLKDEPVSVWPKCDAIISFFSDGFPLEKANEYVAMHPDILEVNTLAAQSTLLDRREVYRTLRENGIPLPRHIMLNRDGYNGEPAPELVRALRAPDRSLAVSVSTSRESNAEQLESA